MQAMIDELAQTGRREPRSGLFQGDAGLVLAGISETKTARLPALMKNLRSVAPEERPAMGQNQSIEATSRRYRQTTMPPRQGEGGQSTAARNGRQTTVDIRPRAPTKTPLTGRVGFPRPTP